LILSERRLDGKLSDLRMEAMAGTGDGKNTGGKLSCNGVDQAMVCLVYITK